MKKILNNTLVIILSLILTACGGGDSSDLNSTKESAVETSSSNEEVIRVEVSSSEEIPNSNSTERENVVAELPTVASSSEESDIQTSISNGGFTVNAGTNKTVSVGQTLTLNGTVNSVDTQTFTYEWKKGNIVLATTASFDYTPQAEDSLPTAGHRVDVLTFTVRTENGDTASDMVNITVLP